MIKSFRGKSPKIDSSAFIAENVVIIGDVEIAEKSNIWYGTVLRGDINSIKVGAQTNIQEGSVIHVDSPNPENEKKGCTIIGENVTIGHGAIIHACEIGENCLIGMGAIILSGAKIGSNSLIAAGSLVREGQEFPPNSLIAGNPACLKKSLSDQQILKIRESAEKYHKLALEHSEL
ncbi:MAG: gamma carbonic anhydrase family protein [Candidatus Riflebacteria bacterium]|nr:gamma carbonic anhydrase family protein [Candidatus Riflebacteria bacterium]